MYKQEHQQSDNKLFRGLWTEVPCRFKSYSFLTLNNRQLLIQTVALAWRRNAQILIQITECGRCGYTVQIGV